ncbi:hypothetical protein CDEST_04072 [Colletotrichum destructivum]|uniref:Uncharacterized protein n=1 Tax=Colletotrichum destructivum TaxID=34406 RepID=A0AAX4I7W3_9PEZI|nr:hypothetical protein CDEST_04072 [Colletotrichum destructivum]
MPFSRLLSRPPSIKLFCLSHLSLIFLESHSTPVTANMKAAVFTIAAASLFTFVSGFCCCVPGNKWIAGSGNLNNCASDCRKAGFKNAGCN